MTLRYRVPAAAITAAALLTATAGAQPQSHQDFLCSSGSMKRVVSIVRIEPSSRRPAGACRVDYTKDGVTKTVWTSDTGQAYCVKRATVLVTKLAEAHYACRPQTDEPADESAVAS